MGARKVEELFLSAENKTGLLEEITQALVSGGVNIRAVSAYVAENKAFFRLITSDNAKASEALANIGSIEKKEAVVAELEDKEGSLNKAAARLKDAGIDLAYIYATSADTGNKVAVVFSSDNNDKSVELLR